MLNVRTMDYTLVIGLVLTLVVGFFAYQWLAKRPAALKRPHTGMLHPAPAPVAPPAVAPVNPEQKEEKFPQINGQTQEEALTKEPIQRREPSSQQQPVNNQGDAPAQFDQHLRHPEQLYHQPKQGQQPSMQVSDVPGGRASPSSDVGPGQQGFSPEMAQNGGAFVGNSVFAFDGMEPTGFTSF